MDPTGNHLRCDSARKIFVRIRVFEVFDVLPYLWQIGVFLSGDWVAIELGGPIRVQETFNTALVAARVVEKSMFLKSPDSGVITCTGRFCATESCVYGQFPPKKHKAEARVLNLPPHAYWCRRHP